MACGVEGPQSPYQQEQKLTGQSRFTNITTIDLTYHSTCQDLSSLVQEQSVQARGID